MKLQAILHFYNIHKSISRNERQFELRTTSTTRWSTPLSPWASSSPGTTAGSGSTARSKSPLPNITVSQALTLSLSLNLNKCWPKLNRRNISYLDQFPCFVVIRTAIGVCLVIVPSPVGCPKSRRKW